MHAIAYPRPLISTRIIRWLKRMLEFFMAFTSASATPTGTGQTLEEGRMATGGYGFETHVVAFATTADTVEVATRLKQIRGWSFGHQGTPNAAEILSLDETVSDFGAINVDAAGFITLRRAAHNTSGLIVCLTLIGQ